MKKYQFKTKNGKTISLSHEELTLGQHLELAPLILGADSGLFNEGLSNPKKLFSAFSKKETVYQALRIILKTDATDEMLAQMPDRLVWEVLEDFLSFNPGLQNGLTSLLSGMISSLIQTGVTK